MLERCLESVRAQTFQDFEVVVVDNASSDGSCDLPFFSLPRWQIVRMDRNTGFAEANNIGIARASGDFIALVNNDVILSDSWTERMVETLANEAEAGSAACRILQQDQPELLDSAGFRFYSFGTCSSWHGAQADLFAEIKHSPFGAVATAALYRRNAVVKTGLFHPEYFAYYEDTDLAVRMILHGFKCTYAHNAVAYHAGSVTGKRHSDFHRYHLRRNIELLYWVDMVGVLAIKNFLPHFLYETACCAGMILKGQFMVFLRAKRNFLGMLPWILKERKKLRSKIERDVSLPVARRNLESNMISMLQAIFVR